jgi:hypothetical protein
VARATLIADLGVAKQPQGRKPKTIFVLGLVGVVFGHSQTSHDGGGSGHPFFKIKKKKINVFIFFNVFNIISF